MTDQEKLLDATIQTRVFVGYCPPSVTVYIRSPFKGYIIYPYYNYDPTVTEGGAVPKVYTVDGLTKSDMRKHLMNVYVRLPQSPTQFHEFEEAERVSS